MKYSAKAMKNSTIATRRNLSRAWRIASTMALSAAVTLTGCSMGSMNLSGPDTAGGAVHLNLNGKVHGGQQPVTGSAIKLWAVGNGGYGSAATNIIGLYPNGSACSTAPDAITAYVIAAGTVTFTANNKLQAGQTVSVSGLTSPTGLLLDGQNFVVTAATATTFTAATSVPATASTTDSGTAIPQCAGSTANGNEILTDGTGSFSITGDYTCPSASTQVYITATGGNPGLAAGTNNTALQMVAPLGNCGALSASTNVFINEVTTAATAFGLGQYFTTTFGPSSTDSFGAPNTPQAQTGMVNAVATVNSLVNTVTGAALTSTNLTGAGYTLQAIPDSAKLYTIANILAACVNSLGTSDPNGNCNSLFTAATPSNATAASDTLQAAVYMSLNPTSTNSSPSATNITTLFNLASTTAPFSGLSTPPVDWTLSIQYQDNVGTFFLKPQNIAVDSTGNVWVLSNNNALGSLVELSPTGTPSSDITTLNTYGPFGYATGSTTTLASPLTQSSLKTTTTQPFGYQDTLYTSSFGTANNNPAINPRNLAIDTNNNVWFTATSNVSDATTGVATNGAVFEVIPGGATHSFSTGKSAYGLAIDGNNNVFVSQQSSSAYFGLYEFPAGNLLTPITYQIPTKTAGTAGTTGTNSYIQTEYMTFDTAGNLWMTAGSASSSQNYAVELANINTANLVTGQTQTCAALTAGQFCQVATSTTANTYNTASIAITDPWGLAANAGGSVWIADAGTSGTAPAYTVTALTSPTAFNNYGSSASLNYPHYLAVDGKGNVWVGSQAATEGTTAVAGGITELSSTGTILSPTSAAPGTTAPGFSHPSISSGGSVAIDPSGNVWIANNAGYVAASSGPPATAAVPSSVIEIVGAAAPTVTPIALALKNGTVATRP